MEKIDMNGVVNTLGSAVKLAANLSEKKPEVTDSSNNTVTNPNQTVQIQIKDEKKEEPKPMIIHDKQETHIHKEFPEERALTDSECALAKERLRVQEQKDIREFEFKKYKYDLDRKDMEALQNRVQQYYEKQEAKNEKRRKVRIILGGIFAALGATAIGYSIYADNRNAKMNTTQSKPALPESSVIPVDVQIK